MVRSCVYFLCLNLKCAWLKGKLAWHMVFTNLTSCGRLSLVSNILEEAFIFETLLDGNIHRDRK